MSRHRAAPDPYLCDPTVVAAVAAVRAARARARWERWQASSVDVWAPLLVLVALSAGAL